MKPSAKILIILVVLLLGLVIRMNNLGKESFWIDEGFSVHDAHLGPSQVIKAASSEHYPPLYYLILHYWMILFGDSEFSVRFVSVIFGFLSIFMIYKIGTLLFNKNTGLISSLILALSIFHIWSSQEARMYSLVVLLTICSFYFFVRLLEKMTYKVSIAYVFFTTLLIYTHYYGFFIMIAQNIYFLTLYLFSKKSKSDNFLRWFLLQGILVILYIPWIGILLNQLLNVKKGYWIAQPGIGSVIDSFVTFSGTKSFLLFFVILSFFSMQTYKKIKGKINCKDFFCSLESYCWNVSLLGANKIYLLLLWLLVPIAFPFIISWLFMPIYLTKYTIVASVAFYLLVARGIENITNNARIKLVIIILLISFSFVHIKTYYSSIKKEQWREVASFIDINAKPNDLILFHVGGITEFLLDYYSKRGGLIKKPFPKEGQDIEEKINEIEPAVEGYNRIWFISSHSFDYKGSIPKSLSNLFNLSHYKEYLGIKLYLFEKDKK